MENIRDEFFEDVKQAEQINDLQSGQQEKNIKHYMNLLLQYCNEPRTAREIKNYLNIKSRQYISTRIIKPLIDLGMLEYTNKKSINARNQKYVTIKDKNHK